eukprot:Skav228603  [mRNA]  locus=scaffold4464:6852:7403:- [translate_table: standard]
MTSMIFPGDRGPPAVNPRDVSTVVAAQELVPGLQLSGLRFRGQCFGGGALVMAGDGVMAMGSWRWVHLVGLMGLYMVGDGWGWMVGLMLGGCSAHAARDAGRMIQNPLTDVDGFMALCVLPFRNAMDDCGFVDFPGLQVAMDDAPHQIMRSRRCSATAGTPAGDLDPRSRRLTSRSSVSSRGI